MPLSHCAAVVVLGFKEVGGLGRGGSAAAVTPPPFVLTTPLSKLQSA